MLSSNGIATLMTANLDNYNTDSSSRISLFTNLTIITMTDFYAIFMTIIITTDLCYFSLYYNYNNDMFIAMQFIYILIIEIKQQKHVIQNGIIAICNSLVEVTQ